MAAEGTDNDDIFQEDDNNDVDNNNKVVIDPIKVSLKYTFAILTHFVHVRALIVSSGHYRALRVY